MTDKHVHRIDSGDVPELAPGDQVLLPTGHAAVVLAVDRERGEVAIEATPWRANFRPSHLRRPGDDER
jgi:preprotein translocase subunit YajC